jgi:hypothetical protein
MSEKGIVGGVKDLLKTNAQAGTGGALHAIMVPQAARFWRAQSRRRGNIYPLIVSGNAFNLLAVDI